MQNIKLAIRSLLRDKAFSIINIAGLTIALMMSVIILLFVHNHYSFDKNVTNPERSYRVVTGHSAGALWASTFAAFEKTLYEHPSIKTSTTFYKNDEEFDIVLGKQKLRIINPIYADTNFMSYFHIPLKIGNPKDIDKPNSVFISEKAAFALFGENNPIGQSIQLEYNEINPNENRTATVVGILSDDIMNMHLKFDLIHSKKGFYEGAISHLQQAKVFGAYVYLTLLPGTSATELENQLTNLITPFIRDAFGPPLSAFTSKLQALSDIHFTPGFTRDFSPAIKRSHLNLLLLVGLLLFAVATFNFLIMNLARSERRLHKTRVLQFLGGTNYSIFKAYSIEILFLVIPSLLLAVLLIQLLNPLLSTSFFNGWSVQIGTLVFWLILSSLGLLITVTSSLATTSFLLKKNLTTENKKAVSLIIFQFVVVIAITTFGILVNKQIHYIHKADLGYSPENIMIFRVPNNTTVNISVFKEKAIAVPGVLAVGSAQQYPGFRIQDTYVGRPENSYPSKFIMVDGDAMHALGVKIIDTLLVSESPNFYLNETFFKSLLKENSLEELSSDKNEPIKKDNPANLNFTINGVVQDFHYASFYNPIENFMFIVQNKVNYQFLLVRFNLQNTASVKSELKTIAASIYNCDIDPVFLDEQLNLEYQSEEQLLSITKIFILLTILIAGMGLFAFSLYSTQRRTKEIGIHKVNGAEVLEILTLLNKNFIQWVVIAFIIATPIAYYAMQKWLSQFAYKTELSWWVFALAGCIALLIALLTVSWQTFRAARRNPIEALRYE